jgi:hypothetical protein
MPPSQTINLQSSEMRPKELSVSYFNRDDNDKTAASVVHWTDADGDPQSVALPCYGMPQPFLNFNEAAMRELQVASGTTQISLMPKFLWVCPGVVLDVPEPTVAEPAARKYLRVVNQSISPSGLVSCDNATYDPQAYQALPDVPRVITPPPTVIDYGRPQTVIIDSVCIDDQMVPQGTVIAACYMPDERTWGGALLHSTDGAWDDATFSSEATVGYTLNTYSYAKEDTTAFHTDKIIRVQLYNGALSSCSESEAYNKVNLLNIGGVYLSFTTATPVGVNLYDLSGLLPARFGSDIITTLPAGSKVVLMTDDSGALDASLTAIPIDRKWKTKSLAYQVYNGANELRVSSGAFTYGANNLRALAPSAWVTVGKDTTDDEATDYGLYLRFMARSRYVDADIEQLSAGLPYRDSDPLNFTVVLSSGGVVYDTRTVTSATSEVVVHYTRAELLATIGSVPHTLLGTIVQNNDVGAGFARTFSATW